MEMKKKQRWSYRLEGRERTKKRNDRRKRRI